MARFCKHHYEFTQGYFFCTKCGHRNQGKTYRKKRNRKIGAGIIITISVLVVGLYFYGGLNTDSVITIVEEIKEKTSPITQTVEEKTTELIQVAGNTSKSLVGDTDSITKEKQAEMEIHRLVNLEREKLSLKPLGYDENLAAVAKSHSKDMNNRGYFAHDTPEGLDPTQRASKAGHTCRYQAGNTIYTGIAENIHMESSSSITFWSSPESIARSAVSGWMNSPGHRENILTPHYRAEGIGISISTFSIYATQNFC